MTAISIDNLSRSYGSRRGVQNLSLTVPEGQLFGFLGPNGAGKTTTIRVLMGFLRPTSGKARIFGRDVWRDGRRIREDVGYLPGDVRLYPWMTGASALRIIGAIRRRNLARVGGPGRELAEAFDLDLRVKVRNMSRGMRQKLGLILALAHQPRLLILDEPTTTLDPLMQEQCRAYLRAQAAKGTTVFFSSHSLNEVEQLCDRVAIVREGRLVADEPLESLRRQAGHAVMIRWRQPEMAKSIEPPPFLDVRERRGSTWHGLLDGPVAQLIDWLAGKDVADLSIGRPDLENLFKRYYRSVEEEDRA